MKIGAGQSQFYIIGIVKNLTAAACVGAGAVLRRGNDVFPSEHAGDRDLKPGLPTRIQPRTIPRREFHGHQFQSFRINARARMIRPTTARSAQRQHHHPRRLARQRRQLFLVEQEQFTLSSTRIGFTPGLRLVEEVRPYATPPTGPERVITKAERAGAGASA